MRFKEFVAKTNPQVRPKVEKAWRPGAKYMYAGVIYTAAFIKSYDEFFNTNTGDSRLIVQATDGFLAYVNNCRLV